MDPGIPLPDLPRRVARRNTELHGATFRIPASNKRQKNLSKLHRRSCAYLHSALATLLVIAAVGLLIWWKARRTAGSRATTTTSKIYVDEEEGLLELNVNR